MEWQPQFDWYPDNSIPPCSDAPPNIVPTARPQQKSFDELLQQVEEKLFLMENNYFCDYLR